MNNETNNETNNDMNTIEKIESVLTTQQINRIKADLMYNLERTPLTATQSITEEAFSSVSRKNLSELQIKTWGLFGSAGMVTIHQAIKVLSK